MLRHDWNDMSYVQDQTIYYKQYLACDRTQKRAAGGHTSSLDGSTCGVPTTTMKTKGERTNPSGLENYKDSDSKRVRCLLQIELVKLTITARNGLPKQMPEYAFKAYNRLQH